jgi:hypothetical protein
MVEGGVVAAWWYLLCNVQAIQQQCARALLLHTSRTKASGSSLSLVEFLHNLDIGHDDSLENQLCDSIAFVDGKVLLTMVEQHHSHIAAIVLIDNTGTDINVILPC